MDYKQVIADSWKYTRANKRLIYWFGFFPSILTTSVSLGYITYQFFAFKKSYLFDNSETSFMHDVINYGWTFISSHASFTIPLIITAAVIFLLWFFVPTIAMASTMQAIARTRNGQKSGVGIGLKYGILAFLPLIELHGIMGTFSPITAITEMGFVLRNLGVELFKVLFVPFLLFFFIGLFLKLLFAYADLYVVIDDEGVFSAMKKSAKLVFMNWQHTVLITILMIIIGVRIIIQALLVFLIPAVVILIGAYVASLALNLALLVVIGIVGVAALLLTSYLNGIVDIFSYSVWTVTFLELTSQNETSARESGEAFSPREVIDTGVKVREEIMSEPTTAAETLKSSGSDSESSEKIPGLL